MSVRSNTIDWARVSRTFTDAGGGAGVNMVTAGTNITVTHALGYTPHIDSVVSVFVVPAGATGNDVAQAMSPVSTAATTITVRPSRTVNESASAGLNTFAVVVLISGEGTAMSNLRTR